ncbi:hypothetical protein [Streptomyces antibioticus]
MAMAAMTWPWGTDLPAAPQAIVFSAGTPRRCGPERRTVRR